MQTFFNVLVEILRYEKSNNLMLDVDLSVGTPSNVHLEKSPVIEGCSLTMWLRAFIYHYIVVPVIKANRIVLGMLKNVPILNTNADKDVD